VVVVIIGIIAAIAIPAFSKGKRAAENGTTYATLRTIASTQVAFYSQNNRFGRLYELQPLLASGIGTTVGDTVVRGRYVFEMVPSNPTDAQLKNEYIITATRNVSDDVVYKYELTQSGKITQILPGGAPE
ncbi:MAG TPA: hypothetical protein VNK26_00490, partial [Pyrinomonadaceae bacterium]|nr:hypothetical protein [Pyrinomonadaceae bacterium]